MKRLIITSTLVAVFTMRVTSCKKEFNKDYTNDYTCDCKDGNGVQFDKQTYPNTSLIDAKRACDERENFWKNGAQPAANCKIL